MVSVPCSGRHERCWGPSRQRRVVVNRGFRTGWLARQAKTGLTSWLPPTAAVVVNYEGGTHPIAFAKAAAAQRGPGSQLLLQAQMKKRAGRCKRVQSARCGAAHPPSAAALPRSPEVTAAPPGAPRQHASHGNLALGANWRLGQRCRSSSAHLVQPLPLVAAVRRDPQPHPPAASGPGGSKQPGGGRQPRPRCRAQREHASNPRRHLLGLF